MQEKSGQQSLQKALMRVTDFLAVLAEPIRVSDVVNRTIWLALTTTVVGCRGIVAFREQRASQLRASTLSINIMVS